MTSDRSCGLIELQNLVSIAFCVASSSSPSARGCRAHDASEGPALHSLATNAAHSAFRMDSRSAGDGTTAEEGGAGAGAAEEAISRARRALEGYCTRISAPTKVLRRREFVLLSYCTTSVDENITNRDSP